MKEITCVVMTSPLPTHPSTEILDETIASIRERLPESEIIVCFDGVPAWNESMRANYEKFKMDMLWKLNEIGAIPLVFDKHMHQTLMLKEALKYVRTPLILFAEGDTPLHNHIPFDKIIPVIMTGYADVVRFHFEATIPVPHEHLMLDKEPIEILGVPFIRTKQWSGRPNLASTEWYKKAAEKYFDDQPRFVEHVLYGPIVEGDFKDCKLHIFAPPITLVTSKHLDGRRAGALEYDPSTS